MLVKIKSQIKYCLGDQVDETDLSESDAIWIDMLDLKFSSFVRPPSPLKDWQIQANVSDFSEFCTKLACTVLFFDGAATGNPGISGAGGITRNEEGRTVLRYNWGVGYNTSIQAEALALLQGLKQLKVLGFKDAAVFGDSQSIIQTIVTRSFPSDLRLARLMTRIRTLSKSFQSLKLFHVKRDNNKDANVEANKAVFLFLGVLLREGDESWDPIP